MDSVEQTIRMNNLSKELRKYGFADSSQEAIAQAGAIYGVKDKDLQADVELVQLTRSQLTEIINKMQRLWLFKENTEQKMSALADQLVKVTDKLNELIKSISLIEMNQAVFDKKLNVLKEKIDSRASDHTTPRAHPQSYSNSSVQEHVEESSNREKDFRKLDKPIDRNGVAPADVSIEKMFYSGRR